MAAPSRCPAGSSSQERSSPRSKRLAKGTVRNCAIARSASRIVYSGSAGECLEVPWRFAYSASSSCRCALSRSRISHSSAVASVA